MKTNIPKWIIGILIIMGLMALFLSFQSISTEGISYAARNAIPAIATIVTLIFFRSSVVAWILILVGRMTIELGDLASALFEPNSAMASMMTMIIVFLAIEAFALYTLSKRLKA